MGAGSGERRKGGRLAAMREGGAGGAGEPPPPPVSTGGEAAAAGGAGGGAAAGKGSGKFADLATEGLRLAVEAAQGAYAGARRAALERERPWPLEPTLEKMEAVASAYGAPVAGRVLDAAPAVFAEIESRAEGFARAPREGLAAAAAARQIYLQRVEELLAAVRREGLSPYYSLATEQLQTALLAAREKVHESAAVFRPYVDRVTEAVAGVLKANPALERTLSSSKDRYLQFHEAVVSSPRYAEALGKGQEALERVQASEYYKRAEQAAAPLMQKALAVPAVAGAVEAATPLASAVLEHLRPTTPPSPPEASPAPSLD